MRMGPPVPYVEDRSSSQSVYMQLAFRANLPTSSERMIDFLIYWQWLKSGNNYSSRLNFNM